MRALDWWILVSTILFVVTYGVWKGRRPQHLESYLLAGREMRWPTIALSIIATQASAITFLSTPGQAYTDGMRFVQFYLGVPIAMVILSITAVPIYHRLKVYTAYEYLETRFGPGTRTLTAILFLIQRGLSTGITIYAPAIILSVLLGWNIHITNVVIGFLVILYTTTGGTRAVSRTHVHQMLIILGGMVAALVIAVHAIPDNVTFVEAVRVAGRMGRLNAIDFSFDLKNRYNFWSGIIGGAFVALSYFGTDQSQVQRYLTGQSIGQSRLGLLCNGLIKVPMQFFILFVGAMVFVFYQFVAPPLFFNTAERAKIVNSHYVAEYTSLQQRHEREFVQKRASVSHLVAAMRTNNEAAIDAATVEVRQAQETETSTRKSAVALLKRQDPKADGSDTNYIFLTFVTQYLPVGVVGLVLAAILCASMSSTASGLNSLASTTLIDLYRRHVAPNATDPQYVRMSRWLTVFWGLFAIGFAEFSNRLGSLIEAVNILGSLFYGTILGIFLLGFYIRSVGGTAAFLGALLGEAAVIYCSIYSSMAYLWWNVIGCAVCVGSAMLIERMLPERELSDEVAT